MGTNQEHRTGLLQVSCDPSKILIYNSFLKPVGKISNILHWSSSNVRQLWRDRLVRLHEVIRQKVKVCHCFIHNHHRCLEKKKAHIGYFLLMGQCWELFRRKHLNAVLYQKSQIWYGMLPSISCIKSMVHYTNYSLSVGPILLFISI